MNHRRQFLIVLSFFLTFALACDATDGRPRADAGPFGDSAVTCDPTADADGDGIADAIDGMLDFDGDGTPNYLDTDSDNDGVLDIDEHPGDNPCNGADADGDGSANWIDTDSDNDGLSDIEEVGTYSTDPFNIDSDGDTITDLAEVRGSMTDPNDRESTIDEGDFFLVLPYMGAAENRDLRFNTALQIADVYFLIDTTGSMQSAINNVTSSLSTLATEIQSRIPNVEFGVGQYRDFPNSSGFGGYGSPSDMPYGHIEDITGDLSAVQAGLTSLSADGGADGPESSVEALYQTATGDGATWTFSSGAPSFALSRRACPARPDETSARRGYPCFRPGSLPIVVLVTDAQFHNGPGDSNAYTGISPAPATFPQAVTALNGIGARFIGVSVGSTPRSAEEEVARMTGSVDTSGTPLVYDAAGGTVSDAIVTGIETLAGATPQDVDTRTENVAGNPDNYDATQFIKSITPVEGYNGSISGAMPGITYTSKDTTTFYSVIPGTDVVFSVRFLNDVRPGGPTAQVYQATIVVRGNGVTDLDSRRVFIIVPPDGATILI